MAPNNPGTLARVPGVIGLFAYGVSIQSHPSRLRALVYAVVVVGLALTVAIVKNLLVGY